MARPPRFNLITLRKRIISALVLGPLTLWIIWSGGIFFLSFCLLGGVLAFYEWHQLSRRLPRPLLAQVLGLFYIALAVVSFYVLRAEFPFRATMACMVLVWASDITAYFAGKFIGGPRMARGISPNKTWAGFAGALLGPAVLAVIWVSFYELPGETSVEYLLIYAFTFMAGALMGVIGQAGDLMISALKRKSGVKDTGQLIPGHGGLLDRIDSLLPNVPLFYVIASAIKYAYTVG